VSREKLSCHGREDLARLSGIVLNYPSLRLAIEGHTDNTGSAETNNRFLSNGPKPCVTTSQNKDSTPVR